MGVRIQHNQTVAGPILLTDIEDGLPNKTAHVMATGNQKAWQTDNSHVKQTVYVPRTMAAEGFPLTAGYIDLAPTDKVLLSRAKGSIYGLVNAGLITAIDFTQADLAAPTVGTAVLATNLTITGTNLLSVAPNLTVVKITGTGAVTLTQTQITAGAGTVSNTSIVIPAALIPSVVATTSSVQVTADLQDSTVVAVS